MNPLYFLRANPWAINFLAADKGGETGSQKPPTVPELTQRVTELEGKLTAEEAKTKDLDGKLTAETAKVTDLQGKLTAEEAKTKDLDGKLTAETAKVADLTGKLTAETAKVTDLTGKLTAETVKVTAAEQNVQVAQTKANETAAAAGMKPPFQQVTKEEGKKNAGEENAGKPPVQRLAAIFDTAAKK